MVLQPRRQPSSFSFLTWQMLELHLETVMLQRVLLAYTLGNSGLVKYVQLRLVDEPHVL
jgi:hypothetical protein